MGKPYSVDLRKRVVAAIEGGMSRNQAARQFGVAISTAIAGCSEWSRPAALLLVRWAVTSRGRFRVSTRPGYRGGSEPAISPCVGWLPSLAGAD